MDYQTYKKSYFVEPPPPPKYEFVGLHGVALYFKEYEAAVDYYSQVLGPPAYVEGKFTKGWQIGNIWLTLFPSQAGNPENAEIHFLLKTPQEAEKLQRAFIDAGGTGEAPSQQLMYEPLWYCPVRDPFGTSILILSQNNPNTESAD